VRRSPHNYLPIKMIKAVFLDWFTTLSRFEPSREKLYCAAFAELGVSVSEELAARGILLGDEFLYTENMRLPLAKRPLEVREEMYQCFSRKITAEAKIEVAPGFHKTIRERIRNSFAVATYVLYDDVLPTLRFLQARGLIMGMVTNFREDIDGYVEKLGLKPFLMFVLTSVQVGFPKPDPRIFQAALEKAGVAAPEVIFVGDQYLLDIVGARNVGIQPVLIDRCDLYPGITDCPRIRTLTEIELFL
jgi:putative hydrolase of the HAD superfamily